MNKKDLALLLLLPVVALCFSVYALQEIKIIKDKGKSNVEVVAKIDTLIKKIEAASPEEAQKNLINYMNNTKVIIHAEQESEKSYINFINMILRDAIICSAILIFLVLLVYYKSSYRRANQNL